MPPKQPLGRRLTNLAIAVIFIGVFTLPMLALGSPTANLSPASSPKGAHLAGAAVADAATDGTPFGGTPWAVPGTIQAEDYNTGGQGVAYNDTDTTNNGGQYRASEAVDIQATTDTGSGFNVGWTRAGEWLKYTINVASSGSYTFNARVAAAAAGASFHAEIDGVNVTGALSVPNTGGNQVWTTLSKSGISFSAGQHVLRVVFDTAVAGGTSVGNYNSFSLSGGNITPTATNTATATATNTSTPTQPSGGNGSPFGGTPWAVPGTIQAEDYNTGGQGVAFNDTDTTNNGGQYRASEAVDIQATTDTGGGFNVGWTRAGEWLKYTVNVAATDSYTFNARVAAAAAGASFHAEIDGVNVSGPLSVPNTGGNQTWITISKTSISLTAGQHVLRVVFDTAVTGGAAAGNFNFFAFSVGDPTPITPTPITPVPPGDGGIQITLRDGWNLQSSAKVSQAGSVISTASFQPQGWYPITVPASVIAGLLQNNVYADPYFGKNFQQINAADFTPSWWYRKAFTLPASESGKRVRLKLEGLGYRANVWFNGTQLANSSTIVGQFRGFEFDVTNKVNYSGTNVLAVQVFKAQNPKSSDLAITFVDWNPNPPDWNMGILNDVIVSTGGAVAVRHPLVITKFDLPSLSVAHLTVVSEVTNSSGSSVSGVLEGKIGSVTFSQPVTLAANETKRVTFANSAYPQLNISNPSIWWPWEYGTPNLNTLDLAFKVGSQVSDSLTTQFGIRQITSTINSSGSRVFSVNGKPILIRGGAWAPDIFQRRSPERQEAEILYVRDLNLNTIRYEGKFEDEHMFNLTDKYGLLVMMGWNCCDAWQTPSQWTSESYTVAYESLKWQMRRLRNHPSMLVFINGSDEPSSVTAVEQNYLKIEADLQWPNPTLSNASQKSSSVSGKTGVKMLGPYEWVPPIYWETDTSHRAGGAWSFSTEISPGPAVPPLDSLVKFIPANHLWPIDDYWTYHAGGGPFNNLNVFTNALNARYGTATSAADYAEKAQIMAYESHRAMFEAYGRHKYTSSGVIQWMMRNAWPSMIWHLYDHYLRPGGSYYGAKNSLEPLHIQYSYSDKAIVVVNSFLTSHPNLKASAAVYNLDGTQKYSNSVTLTSVGGDKSVTAFTLPTISGLSSTYFLRLTLTDANNEVVSLQTYWLSTKADVLNWGGTQWYYTPTSSYADFKALASLPKVNVSFTERIVPNGARNDHYVTVTNNSTAIAFFTHLKITKGASGEELLPILWQDNYFTLLPGESREIKASYAVADLGGATPVVKLDTWNNR